MTDDQAKLEAMLEAARRANWDAQHGPTHLRTGRYVVAPPRTDDGQSSSAAACSTGVEPQLPIARP
jgi:putative IMPACT (imprinted ancient) family translation regulator